MKRLSTKVGVLNLDDDDDIVDLENVRRLLAEKFKVQDLVKHQVDGQADLNLVRSRDVTSDPIILNNE